MFKMFSPTPENLSLLSWSSSSVKWALRKYFSRHKVILHKDVPLQNSCLLPLQTHPQKKEASSLESFYQLQWFHKGIQQLLKHYCER